METLKRIGEVDEYTKIKWKYHEYSDQTNLAWKLINKIK